MYLCVRFKIRSFFSVPSAIFYGHTFSDADAATAAFAERVGL